MHTPACLYVRAQTDQLARRRLKILSINYDFHVLMNGQLEHDATTTSGTDFWACMKVRGVVRVKRPVRRACV